MVLKSSISAILVASLAILTYAPQTDAHSWADCIDWRFNTPGKEDWTDNGGRCEGYARRYPTGKAFASLDSADPNRHYQQDNNNPNSATACSNGRDGEEPGADETLGNPVSSAYGGKYGKMTVTSVGDTLCVRWPAKNHAVKDEVDNKVQINLSKVRNGKDISQQELLKNTIAQLSYKNCDSASNEDKRPCGGCFKVPVRASGVYLLQWRWMLNPDEWYTSCADIQIGAGGNNTDIGGDIGNGDNGTGDNGNGDNGNGDNGNGDVGNGDGGNGGVGNGDNGKGGNGRGDKGKDNGKDNGGDNGDNNDDNNNDDDNEGDEGDNEDDNEGNEGDDENDEGDNQDDEGDNQDDEGDNQDDEGDNQDDEGNNEDDEGDNEDDEGDNEGDDE